MDGVPLSELTSEQLDELTYNDVKRVISELEVFEVSVVNVPANPSTLFTLTKALKSYFTNLDDTKMNGEVIIKDAETKEILEEIEVKEVIEKEVEEKDGEAMSTDDVETKEEKVVEEKEIGGEEDDDEELEVEEEEVADEVTEDTEEEVEEEAPETEAPAEEADQDSEKSMSELREKVAQLEDLLDKSLEAYETLAEKHIELAEAVGSLPVNKAYAVVGGQKEAKEVKGELARAREVALG